MVVDPELANFNVTQAETVEKNRQGRLDRILKGIETTGGGLARSAVAKGRTSSLRPSGERKGQRRPISPRRFPLREKDESHTVTSSGRRDSNPGPPGPKPGALTKLRYAPCPPSLHKR